MLHIRVLALAFEAPDGANREPLLHQADRRGRWAPLVDFLRSRLKPSVPLEQFLAAELEGAGAGLALLVGRVKLVLTELNLSEQIHIYLLIQFDTGSKITYSNRFLPLTGDFADLSTLQA